MPLAVVALIAIVLFTGAFFVYGRFVARLFRLDPNRPTPACTINDGVDFIPTRPPMLLAQHFAAIAAAGPIVGPIVAGLAFGWLPAVLWILFGAILIGACHDFAALAASLRHGARSVTEVVREHIGTRAYLCFLGFIWLSLVYVIIAFTDLTSQQFVKGTLEEGFTSEALQGGHLGGGVATASIAYLVLAVGLGLWLGRLRLPLWLGTLVFVPLLFISVWIGQLYPVVLPERLGIPPAIQWDFLILAYCAVASVLPMWLLLQPRGYLGGYFLYAVLAAGFLGMLFGGIQTEHPAFKGFTNEKVGPLFPFLFVTIACGACSGFHGLVSSGTTSKQVAREDHAPLIGYGGMLLEGFVAVMALGTLMMLAPEAEALRGKPVPNVLYARGIGTFLERLTGLPRDWGTAFGMLAFATFIFDTLDVATRLGRYILQELLGWTARAGRIAATLLTLGVPAGYIVYIWLSRTTDPVWSKVWLVFGASNQLLAGLTLAGIAAWLTKTGRTAWPIALPAVFMLGMTGWSLALMARTPDANGVTAIVLLLLAGFMIWEIGKKMGGAVFGLRPSDVASS